MKASLPAVFLIALLGCKPDGEAKPAGDEAAKYEAAFDSGNELLGFWIEDLSGGPIKGGKETTDPVPSAGSADLLVRLLSDCGETRFLIDHSWTHHEYVSVPMKKNNPARSLSDFELVDCVRKSSPFSFGAGIGRVPDVDPSSFKSLYAQKN
ncbi:protein of unknown function [uncultured Sphingopyxis sp.]|uniref:Lipoprotein n=1 Tax=uncultured Sphingopyxis sp. TaxID=310581 RepID=A0A1Y5PVZ3_9SPHN|nr:hypothetical protein [uncultured Sphingopyxis sp.]SBV34151.1 protein of unknown function [uncultured Sphingopyxis sp.]